MVKQKTTVHFTFFFNWNEVTIFILSTCCFHITHHKKKKKKLWGYQHLCFADRLCGSSNSKIYCDLNYSIHSPQKCQQLPLGKKSIMKSCTGKFLQNFFKQNKTNKRKFLKGRKGLKCQIFVPFTPKMDQNGKQCHEINRSTKKGFSFILQILKDSKKLIKLMKAKGKDYFVQEYFQFVSPNCLWFSFYHHLAPPLHHLNLHHCPV